MTKVGEPNPKLPTYQPKRKRLDEFDWLDEAIAITDAHLKLEEENLGLSRNNSPKTSQADPSPEGDPGESSS